MRIPTRLKPRWKKKHQRLQTQSTFKYDISSALRTVKTSFNEWKVALDLWSGQVDDDQYLSMIYQYLAGQNKPGRKLLFVQKVLQTYKTFLQLTDADADARMDDSEEDAAACEDTGSAYEEDEDEEEDGDEDEDGHEDPETLFSDSSNDGEENGNDDDVAPPRKKKRKKVCLACVLFLLCLVCCS